MADITITIPNAQLARVVDALVGGDSGYAAAIEGNPSPPTKNQLARQRLIDHVKNIVRNYEAGVAAQTAYTAADSQVSVT